MWIRRFLIAALLLSLGTFLTNADTTTATVKVQDLYPSAPQTVEAAEAYAKATGAEKRCEFPATLPKAFELYSFDGEITSPEVRTWAREKHLRTATCGELRYFASSKKTVLSAAHVALDLGSTPTPPDQLDFRIAVAAGPRDDGAVGNMMMFVPGTGRWVPGVVFVFVEDPVRP